MSLSRNQFGLTEPGRELIYIGLLTLTATAVIINGLLGGMLTHGMRHLMF